MIGIGTDMKKFTTFKFKGEIKLEKGQEYAIFFDENKAVFRKILGYEGDFPIFDEEKIEVDVIKGLRRTGDNKCFIRRVLKKNRCR